MAPQADREPIKLISYPDLLGTRLIFVSNLFKRQNSVRSLFIPIVSYSIDHFRLIEIPLIAGRIWTKMFFLIFFGIRLRVWVTCVNTREVGY